MRRGLRAGGIGIGIGIALASSSLAVSTALPNPFPPPVEPSSSHEESEPILHLAPDSEPLAHGGRLDFVVTLSADGVRIDDLTIDATVNAVADSVVVGSTMTNTGGPNAGGTDGWIGYGPPPGRISGLLPTWWFQVGTTGDDSADAVIVLEDRLIVAGTTTGDVAGVNAGGLDVWVFALDLEGGVIWATLIGSPADEEVTDIVVDDLGVVRLLGSTGGDLFSPNLRRSVDPGVPDGSPEWLDAWSAGIDPNDGTLSSPIQFGTTGADSVEAAFGAESGVTVLVAPSASTVRTIYSIGASAEAIGSHDFGSYDVVGMERRRDGVLLLAGNQPSGGRVWLLDPTDATTQTMDLAEEITTIAGGRASTTFLALWDGAASSILRLDSQPSPMRLVDEFAAYEWWFGFIETERAAEIDVPDGCWRVFHTPVVGTGDAAVVPSDQVAIRCWIGRAPPTATITASNAAGEVQLDVRPVFDDRCDVFGHPFSDLASDSYAQRHVACLYLYGVSVGTSPTTYGPDEFVTRRQMAFFLGRLLDSFTECCRFLDLEGEELTVGFTRFEHPFEDRVPVHATWLYEYGITTGVAPNRYGPGLLVTRAQMAAFVGRTMNVIAPGSCADSHPFVDVDPGSFASPHVACLYERDITTGTSATTFSPGDFVTREQMAAFLGRTIAYLDGVVEDPTIGNPCLWTHDPDPPHPCSVLWPRPGAL